MTYYNYIGSVGPVILVNVYALSIQVMEYPIKLLPLLGVTLSLKNN